MEGWLLSFAPVMFLLTFEPFWIEFLKFVYVNVYACLTELNAAYLCLHVIYRLGHREQKDEWAPRRVDVFQRQNVLPPNAIISAGSVNSSCTAGT